METKKRLLSGMRATGGGLLHLGNYEGALKTWVRLQDEYEMFCFVADWHTFTANVGSGDDVCAASHNVALDYLAAGLDPEKCAIFRQSDVMQHAELAVLLGMYTPVSWLERVPTFKEAREQDEHNEGGGSAAAGVSFGLLGYPVLQAADILIYRAHAVPVGKDQAAHLELSREIARRFNHLHETEYFPEPAALISDETGVLPGLDGRKMSKSYGNTILLSDSADVLATKLKTAYTSPHKIKKTDPGEPEGCSVCRLRRIYDPIHWETQWDECRSGERGCVQSKKETVEVLVEVLRPIRERREQYAQDPAELDNILARGAEKARVVAEETVAGVRRLMKIR